MTIKQRKRCKIRSRAHATGVSRAIGRPGPRARAVPRPVDIDLTEIAVDTLTVAKLQALATRRGVAFRAKDRKADLIAKIMTGATT